MFKSLFCLLEESKTEEDKDQRWEIGGWGGGGGRGGGGRGGGKTQFVREVNRTGKTVSGVTFAVAPPPPLPSSSSSDGRYQSKVQTRAYK